ncbi:DUF2182 domain-containing protein [Vreelandella boliviensis]|nr:DUF2182 domain-containing protein [Halomonas boliviensis]EHJ91490.1 hypothetical protein KUC_3040 [Halomonas boliviensis LC1]
MSTLHARERLLTWLALMTLAILAWGYLIMHGLHMPMPMNESMGRASNLDLSLLGMATLMWSVMMVAMMLPSAGPMILTYLRINQQHERVGGAIPATWIFVSGYLAVWLAFAIAAAVMQWALHESALLSSSMGHVSSLLGGTLLMTAGVFQFSNLKQACLSKCRSPLSFLMTEWREGKTGALTMGIKHGAYCTGCCWALMLLMFVGGVMSLVWMAGLALYLLAEKLLPQAERISQISGGLLAGAGVIVLLSAAY